MGQKAAEVQRYVSTSCARLMKFTDIYNRVIRYWDTEILISDGYPAGCQDGYLFPTLDKVFGRAEETVGHSNAWDELMVWTMLQVFWTESKRLIEEGKTHLKTREVSLLLIEERYFLNLKCEGWEEIRAAYERGET